MSAFLASMAMVFMAEMADKTQLLSMAFATRFKASTVLLAVFASTATTLFLAVIVGNYASEIVPIAYVQVLAAVSFILFGVWGLKGEGLEGEDRRFKFSPFWTVAVAFFLAEMGDKTQLASLALAAKYQSFFPVWIGSTIGMVLSDAVGILVGVILGKKLPEKKLKWVAAVIFILFGLWGLYEYLPDLIQSLS